MGPLVDRIRQFAFEIGFDLVGFTPADPLPEEELALKTWLAAGYAGEMTYMARDPERRVNPRKTLPDAKSIICLAMNYYPGDPPEKDGLYGRISRYAWGKDYHLLIEEKLDRLERYLRSEAGQPVQVKRYVDHGPLLERAYASRAGLGFIGKNTMLITRSFGSWVFLAELITDLELDLAQSPEQKGRATSLCGNCTLCVDACPTGAITAPYRLDARRCISYLTIEHKTEIPPNLQPRMEGWVFGCDVCQEVCPYNHETPVAKSHEMVEGAGPWLDIEGILQMDDRSFKSRFNSTPLLRPKHWGMQRNARAVARTIEKEAGRTK